MGLHGVDESADIEFHGDVTSAEAVIGEADHQAERLKRLRHLHAADRQQSHPSRFCPQRIGIAVSICSLIPTKC
jgi:hypothetical protein